MIHIHLFHCFLPLCTKRIHSARCTFDISILNTKKWQQHPLEKGKEMHWKKPENTENSTHQKNQTHPEAEDPFLRQNLRKRKASKPVLN